MTEPKKRKTRVVWTEKEHEILAEHALLTYIDDTTYLWDLIARSQDCLPKNRRRQITGKNSISADLVQKFIEVRDEYFSDLAAMASVEIQVETENLVPVEKTTEEYLKEATIESLIGELLTRMTPVLSAIPGFMERIVMQQQHHINREVYSAPRPAPEARKEVVPPKPKIPKILFLEFLPGQEEEIRKKIESEGLQVDLVFGGKNRREQVPKTCGWLIINTKVSHSLLHRIQKKVTSGRRFVVSGVTSAVDRVKKICEE